MKKNVFTVLFFSFLITSCFSQTNDNSSFLQISFDETDNHKIYTPIGNIFTYEYGIDGKCLTLNSDDNFSQIELPEVNLDGQQDFTLQFWVKTTSTKPMVFVSQKQFNNKSIDSQKNKGWALYSSGGTFGWSAGSGSRRLNYERDNGHIMPINDGEWHLLSLSYNKKLNEFRLYYDGNNVVTYKTKFDFGNDNTFLIGGQKKDASLDTDILQNIKIGAKQLQNYVNAFNKLNVGQVKEDEFISLIVEPKALYQRKLKNIKSKAKDQNPNLFDTILKIKDSLHSNPYTVSQNHELTLLKPINKLYSLVDGTVKINTFYSKKYSEAERLYPSNFSIDDLKIWNKPLDSDQIFEEFSKYKKANSINTEKQLDTLTVAVWNIWHGGKHFTISENGWDSRKRIAEILKKYKADIILMQETYSSGDFIAAELGYHFATTSDWDYKMQGSNISVMSKFTILEVEAPDDAEFMNISAKIALSETQNIYAMSNWYGMSSFPLVYEHHKEKFNSANTIPILFGGDFNAVPHIDNGNSEASKILIENQFTDAYRNLHPDYSQFPGFTHTIGERIDQLYFKGHILQQISTEVISTASDGFPSDHYMIISKFVIK
jgi:exonuclease III